MRITKAIERWFKIPKDPDKARVLVKHLRPGEVQDIIDQVMVQEIVYEQPEEGENPKGVLTQKNNRKMDREKTILACVTNWENFYDEEGKLMACDEANIMRAIKMIDGFTDFVGDCRKTLTEDVGNEMLAQKKT